MKKKNKNKSLYSTFKLNLLNIPSYTFMPSLKRYKILFFQIGIRKPEMEIIL